MPDNSRRRNAAHALAEAALDGLIVTHLPNARYLTGFTGSNAAVLLDRDGDATLYTDPRYTIQAGRQADCRIRIAKGKLATAVMERVRRRGMRRVGFERDHLSVAAFEALGKDLPVKASLEPTSGLIENERRIKDQGEIAAIRESVALNSRALENALELLKPGMTESELAAEIDYQSRRLGAEAPAFSTIVAAGERAALPHAQPGEAKIGPGMILIDMGAFLHGYASDMSRMVYLGKAPRRYRTVYRAVLEAQRAAIDAIRDGVKTSVVDRAARDVLKAHGRTRIRPLDGPWAGTRNSRSATNRAQR